MSHQPERALTRSRLVQPVQTGYRRRNESSAREGIDTCRMVGSMHSDGFVEMSHQPERALTQFSRCQFAVDVVPVEMSHQPERALTPSDLRIPGRRCGSRNELRRGNIW